MSNPLPSVPPLAKTPTVIPVDSSSGLWDRITTWASENKAVVYTAAGVAVVATGAGVIYFLNSDSVRFYSCFLPAPGTLLSSCDPIFHTAATTGILAISASPARSNYTESKADLSAIQEEG